MDGSSVSIQNQLESLQSKFEVRALSIPAENRTPWNVLVKTAISLLQDESEDFGTHSITAREISLCGESFGACLALSLVAQSPKLFNRLVLINPATSFRQQAWSFLTPFVVKQIPNEVYHLLTFGFLSFLTAKERVSNENQQALLDAIQTFTPSDVAWRLSLLQQFQVTPASLQCIYAPVLLIAASDDRLLPSVKEARKLSKWMPNAQIVKLEHSGHACLLERNLELYKLLESANFL